MSAFAPLGTLLYTNYIGADSQMNADHYYAVNTTRVVYKIIGKEAIILDVETGFSYSFNETGTLIWEGLNNGLKASELMKRLSMIYNTPQISLNKDLSLFLSRLKKEKLIESLSVKKKSNKSMKTVTFKNIKRKNYETPKITKYNEIKRGRSIA